MNTIKTMKTCLEGDNTPLSTSPASLLEVAGIENTINTNSNILMNPKRAPKHYSAAPTSASVGFRCQPVFRSPVGLNRGSGWASVLNTWSSREMKSRSENNR